MPIPFTCPYCGRFTSVGDEYAGQDGPCGGCGATVTIPGPASLNPYESPANTWVPYDDTAQLQGGLAWILFSFEGRIPRRIWWIVSILKNVVIWAAMFGFIGLAAAAEAADVQEPQPEVMFGVMAMFLIFALIAAVPITWISIAVTVKRFHDRDKSGWWYLISFVPYIGPLWILVDCGCLRGTYGPNMYGPDPT